MRKLIWLFPLLLASTASASYIPNLGPLQLLKVDGSTGTVGYQGNVSSIPVSVIGTANSQVVTSTLQVQVGNTVPVTGTFFQTTQPISGAVSGSGPYSVTAGTGSFTMGFVGATGSTVSASYQGAISSVPVSIQGTANVQVVTSTLQVTGSMEVLTSTLQVTGSVEVLTSTLQVTGSMSVTASTVQVNVAGLPAITKGTQGATGITTQDLKDAGRVHVTYYVTASTVGATTAESALVFTKASATSATSSAYTFAITNGKTYRITNISIATLGNATPTAQSTIFNLRVNTAANCSAASTPVIWSSRSATPATASTWDRLIFDIPDGLQIAGTSTLQICASVNSTFTTNAPTADMIISGYEY